MPLRRAPPGVTPGRVAPGPPRSAPAAAARLPPPLLPMVMMVMMVAVGVRAGAQATSVNRHSLNPNSSLWDMDYEGLLHSKKALPGTVGPYKPSGLLRSGPLLSHQGRRRWLSQNLGQKPPEKQLSCDVLLKLSRYILMDTFGPSLAWNLFRFYNCDREVNLPKIHIGPLKVAQHKVKPFLLRRVLRLLRSMGVLSEAQQSKAFSLLKKQMLKPRKTPLKPKVEQSGRYIRRRCGFGISNAFRCWLGEGVGLGAALPGRGVPARADITGCNLVRGGPVWCWGLALSVPAELEPGLGVPSPEQEVCDEAGRKQSLSAGEGTLDWYGVQRAVVGGQSSQMGRYKETVCGSQYGQ